MRGAAAFELALGLALATLTTTWAAARARDASGIGGEGAAGASALSQDAAPPSGPPTDEPDVPPGGLGPIHDDDRALPSHAEEVHVTTITAKLDPVSHVVSGDERIVWRNTSRVPATELWVHLYLNAFKNERTAFLRTRLGAGRGSRVPTDWGFVDVKSMRLAAAEGALAARVGEDLWALAERSSPGDPEDETDLRVPLPAPIAPGGEVTLELAFDAKLPTITERTGYLGSFHMVAQWFPKLARHTKSGAWEHFAFHRLSEFSADFGRYDVTLDVPDGFLVGATGRRVADAHAGGRSITRWEQADVHDFAWSAWDRFEERTAKVGAVDVRVLTPPGYAAAAAIELETVTRGLGCLGRRYGAYPYDVLTVVHPPSGADEAGGMEYPALITTGGAWHGTPPSRALETVTLHELGHQWFYGMVATNEHVAPFLDEGVNSYAEAACLRERFGDASALALPGLPISLDAVHREVALLSGLDTALGAPADSFPTASHYGALVYWRTSTLLRAIDGAFGPGMVDRALARYARAYRFGHPDVRHLLDAFEQAGGPRAREALATGLFERGWVDYAVVDLGSARHASPLGVFDRLGGRETITATTSTGDYDGWALVVRRGSLKLPVDVELTFRDGTRRTVRWDGQSDWVRVAWSRAPEIAGVAVDPSRLVAIDERHSNDARALVPSWFGRAAAERASYLLGLASFLAAP